MKARKELGLTLAAAALAAVLFAVPGCSKKTAASTGSEAAAVPTIRLGRVGAGLNAIDSAIIDGAYTKAGVNVEKKTFSNGADGIAAMIGGSLDLVLGSYEHVLRQIDKGLDVRAYALISNTQGYKLITKTDSPFYSLTDLRGKKIGVTKVGSLSDSTIRKLLSAVGVNPERDVEIINGGTGATIVAALDTGSVDAAMVTDPTTSVLVTGGKYRILDEAGFETAGLVIMGTKKWAEANAGALRTFLAATQTELKAHNANPEAFIAVFKPQFPEIDDGIILSTIKNNILRAPIDLVVTKAAADDVLEAQFAQGTISRKIPLEEGFDGSYLPK